MSMPTEAGPKGFESRCEPKDSSHSPSSSLPAALPSSAAGAASASASEARCCFVPSE